MTIDCVVCTMVPYTVVPSYIDLLPLGQGFSDAGLQRCATRPADAPPWRLPINGHLYGDAQLEEEGLLVHQEEKVRHIRYMPSQSNTFSYFPFRHLWLATTPCVRPASSCLRNTTHSTWALTDSSTLQTRISSLGAWTSTAWSSFTREEEGNVIIA